MKEKKLTHAYTRIRKFINFSNTISYYRIKWQQEDKTLKFSVSTYRELGKSFFEDGQKNTNVEKLE
jgi:hypothetical protein